MRRSRLTPLSADINASCRVLCPIFSAASIQTTASSCRASFEGLGACSRRGADRRGVATLRSPTRRVCRQVRMLGSRGRAGAWVPGFACARGQTFCTLGWAGAPVLRGTTGDGRLNFGNRCAGNGLERGNVRTQAAVFAVRERALVSKCKRCGIWEKKGRNRSLLARCCAVARGLRAGAARSRAVFLLGRLGPAGCFNGTFTPPLCRRAVPSATFRGRPRRSR